VVIRRQTSEGDRPPESYGNNDIAKALIESGIGAYLNANHGTHETILAQGIAELIWKGRRGTILDTARTNPVEEIRSATETMLAREEDALARNPRMIESDTPPWKARLKKETGIEGPPPDPAHTPPPAAGAAEQAKRRDQQIKGPQR
jgi:hypothetical protein